MRYQIFHELLVGGGIPGVPVVSKKRREAICQARIIGSGKSARQSLGIRRQLRCREESPGSIGRDAS